MKKLFAILLAAVLLLPVLAGCERIEALQQPPATTLPQVDANTSQGEEVSDAVSAVQYITPEEAKAIALQDAGLKESEVRDLEAELDKDDGTVHYDVDFEKGEKDYDYDIDAVTGKILRSQKPAEEKPTEQPTEKPTEQPTEEPTPTTATEEQLTKNEARDIALKHAGVKVSEIRDLDVELDKDGGTLHYDVDFEKGSYDYEYEIDAKTGKILRSNKTTDEKPTEPTPTTATEEQLTKNEAKAIALKHAGAKESEVRDLEVELDKDDGTLHYDVNFEKGGYDYEYEINAKTGKILKSQKEKD